MKRLTVVLAVLAASCTEHVILWGTIGDGSTDVHTDPDWYWDTIDTWYDWPPPPDDHPVDPGPDTGCTAPPDCPNAPPDHARIGGPCISEIDCGSGNTCLSESVRTYNGEVYASWLGGTCAIFAADEAGCDPSDPSTCPPGTACLHFGSSGGSDYYGCIDACSFTDTSWNPYDWNCGCRQGYQCNPRLEACLPGCSNDRECCEVWDDLDEDLVMDPSEVHIDDVCTNWCDGDDPDEYWYGDCRASFSCINEGNPDATWHSECLFDSDCPRDARCLNEVYYQDPATGDPLYPGGMCTKDRCEIFGLHCDPYSDLGGDCVNFGSTTSPEYACIATCTTGCHDLHSPDNPCRHPEEGHPYACHPHPDHLFYPGTTRNGICLPATIPEAEVSPMYGQCTADEGCASPFGLGLCVSVPSGASVCSAACDATLTVDCLICGSAPSGEIAPGVCAMSMCLAGCPTPEGPLGSNGCPSSRLACYPNDGSYNRGDIADKASGCADPSGFCLPACASSSDCAALFGPGFTCNPGTGVCG